MNISDLTRSISAKTGFTQPQVRTMFDSLIDVLSASLESNESIRVRGFGSFKLKTLNARKGRNPITGEGIDIPARNVIRFTPSFALKESVKEATSLTT
jgi:nucleoid DNA-binding protein